MIHFSDEPVGRRFYINKNYGGCAVDVGWIAVYDSGPGCTYEHGLQYPAFAYMPNNIMGQWDLKSNYQYIKTVFFKTYNSTSHFKTPFLIA